MPRNRAYVLPHHEPTPDSGGQHGAPRYIYGPLPPPMPCSLHVRRRSTSLTLSYLRLEFNHFDIVDLSERCLLGLDGSASLIPSPSTEYAVLPATDQCHTATPSTVVII